MSEIISYSLLVGVSGAWLLVFALLYRRGSVKVAEPNRYIKGFEFIMLATILGFAIWMVVKWVKEHVHK